MLPLFTQSTPLIIYWLYSMLSQRQQCWTNYFTTGCVCLWITHLILYMQNCLCFYKFIKLHCSASFYIIFCWCKNAYIKKYNCIAQKVESNHWAYFISYGFEVRTPYQWRSSTHYPTTIKKLMFALMCNLIICLYIIFILIIIASIDMKATNDDKKNIEKWCDVLQKHSCIVNC